MRCRRTNGRRTETLRNLFAYRGSISSMSILYPIYIHMSRDTVDNYWIYNGHIMNKGLKRLRYATHSHPRPQSVAMYYIITPSVVRGLPTVANTKPLVLIVWGISLFVCLCVGWGVV